LGKLNFEVKEDMWVWFLEKMMRLITMGFSKITISGYLLLRTGEVFSDVEFPWMERGVSEQVWNFLFASLDQNLVFHHSGQG
jgi:hypothetical protein